MSIPRLAAAITVLSGVVLLLEGRHDSIGRVGSEKRFEAAPQHHTGNEEVAHSSLSQRAFAILSSLDEGAPGGPLWAQSRLELSVGERAYRRLLTARMDDMLVREEDATRAIAEADVVIVADVHTWPMIRCVLPDLVCAVCSARALRRGIVALALEAIPHSRQADVDALRHQEGPGRAMKWRQLLGDTWPWPLACYPEALVDARLAEVKILCVGDHASLSPLPRETPDRFRSGVPVTAMQGRALALALNRNLVEAVAKWFHDHPGNSSQVVALCGAGHSLGDLSVLEDLEKLGMTVVVLVPFDERWELTIRRRFGAEAVGKWSMVLPGVYRPPTVTDSLIVRWQRYLMYREPVAAISDEHLFEISTMLRSPSPERRLQGAWRAERVGTPVLLPQLEALLKDSEHVRVQSVRAIGRIALSSDAGRRALCTATRNEHLRVRVAALRHLALAANYNGEVVETLLGALQRSGIPAHVYEEVGLALGGLLVEADTVVPHLCRIVSESSDSWRRRRAAFNLAHYAPEDKRARHFLLKWKEDPDPAIRQAAEFAEDLLPK